MRRGTLYPGIFTSLWLLPVLALLQVSLAGHFTIRGVFPSLVLIAVVNWGILRGLEEGMVWAFVGGICLDIFSGWPMGANTVALVIVAAVVSLGQGTFIRTHVLLPVVTVFGATILYYLVVLFILETLQQPVDLVSSFSHFILPAAIYNGVVNLGGFWLIQRLEARVNPTVRATW